MSDQDDDSPDLIRNRFFHFCIKDQNVSLLGLLRSLTPTPTHHKTEPDDPQAAAIADYINNTRDPNGEYGLHIAALSGSADAVDVLTDQVGVEIEPRAKFDGAYPLHRVVECALKHLGQVSEEEKTRNSIRNVELLGEAGHSTQVRNKDKRRPIDLIDEREDRLLKLRLALIKASRPPPSHKDSDVVDEDGQSDGGHGSASDDE